MSQSQDETMHKVGDEETVFEGRLIEVVHQAFRQPSGIKQFEYARRAPGTRIFLLDKDGQVLLAREYRRELGRDDIRVPGGKVFDTLREFRAARATGRAIAFFAEEAAARELLEETGYRAHALEPLGVSPCGATVEWDLHYFLCRDWSAPGEDFAPSADENVRSFWSPPSQVRAMCLDGHISEERTALRLLRLLGSDTER